MKRYSKTMYQNAFTTDHAVQGHNSVALITFD